MLDLDVIRCRCCLESGLETSRPLEDMWMPGVNYLHMLDFLGGLDQSLIITNYVCEVCEIELIEAYQFKQKCLRSQNVVSKILEQKQIVTDDTDLVICEYYEPAGGTTSSEKADSVQNNEYLLEDNITYWSNESNSVDVVEEGACLLDDAELVSEEKPYDEDELKLFQNENYRFQCSLCDSSFSTEHTYLEHYDLNHSGNERFRCENCEQIFISKDYYEMHCCKEHKESFAESTHNIKNIEFQDEDSKNNEHNLKEESSTINNDNIQCYKCELQFSIKDEYLIHYDMEHGDREPRRCGKCGERFDFKRDYDKHYRKTHRYQIRDFQVLSNNEYYTEDIPDFNPIKCHKCNIVFATKKCYKLHHSRTHRNKKKNSGIEKIKMENVNNDNQVIYLSRQNESKLKQIKCCKCNIVFDTIKDYKAHHNRLHRSQSQGSERTCTQCDMKFDHPKYYFRHVSRYHLERMVCPLCGKLVHPHRFRAHQLSHNEEKNYKCNICDRSFTHNGSLSKHIRVHMDDRRYKCQYCDKMFLHWNARRLHIINWHTGDKKHVCTVCQMKFGLRNQLVEHLRKHSGERNHECEVCSKKFLTKTSLKNHMTSHSDEKNEKCIICEKAFKTTKSLKVHLKTHTDERDYSCPKCPKSFTQAHVLRSHMRTHPDCPIPPRGSILSNKKRSEIAEKKTGLL